MNYIAKLRPVVFFLIICESQSAVIWNNGLDLGSFGGHFTEGSLRVADDFTLSSSETIRSAQFWGTHLRGGSDPAVEAFTLNIYSDISGVPDALVASSSLTIASKTDTGADHNNIAGANIINFIVDLDNPISLGAETYWLSIYSTSNLGGNLSHLDTDFVWQEAGNSGNSFRSTDSGTTWETRNTPLSFNLSNTSTIPEPSTLFLIGICGLVSIFRRRGS